MASIVHLQAGMEMFRKVWSLLLRKRRAASFSWLEKSVSSTPSVSSRNSRDVPALFRLWPSSPIWRIWAIMVLMSISPINSSAARSTGYSPDANQFSRSITSWSQAPKRSTLPKPSLKVQ